jgi:beta-glucosidase
VGHIQSIYNHKPSSYFKGYKDAPTRNLFEFGLNYTNFDISTPVLADKSISASGKTTVSVTVKNSGKVVGTEIVQLYINDEYSQVTRPIKELKAFKRVHLAAGEQKQVEFEVTAEMLSYYNLAMEWVAEPGNFIIMVGNSSREQDLKTVNLLVK